MAPLKPSLNRPWRRSFPNRSFATWTTCERCCIGLPRSSPRQPRRSPPRRREALEITRPRRLPWTARPLKRAPRRLRTQSRTRRKPRINRGTGTASAGSGCRLPPGPRALYVSNGLEGFVLERGGESVEDLVHLAPVLQRFHSTQPAVDVRIRRVVATQDLAESDERTAEIVCNRDLLAAQKFLLRPEQAFIENLQPPSSLFLAPGDRARVRLVAAPLVVREDLRINQSIGEFAADLRIDPVHHFVHLRPHSQLFRVR